jgi:hypothetical protein
VVQSQETVARYQLSRYANALNSQDCFFPNPRQVAIYDEEWLASVQNLPTYNLSDITIDNTLFQGEDYYYCVALSADAGLVTGYPQ